MSTRPARSTPSPPSSVLADLLVIDGVTDLAVYRMLTGRFESVSEPDPPPESVHCEGQLVLFPVLPCGGDE